MMMRFVYRCVANGAVRIQLVLFVVVLVIVTGGTTSCCSTPIIIDAAVAAVVDYAKNTVTTPAVCAASHYAAVTTISNNNATTATTARYYYSKESFVLPAATKNRESLDQQQRWVRRLRRRTAAAADQHQYAPPTPTPPLMPIRIVRRNEENESSSFSVEFNIIAAAQNNSSASCFASSVGAASSSSPSITTGFIFLDSNDIQVLYEGGCCGPSSMRGRIILTKATNRGDGAKGRWSFATFDTVYGGKEFDFDFDADEQDNDNGDSLRENKEQEEPIQNAVNESSPFSLVSHPRQEEETNTAMFLNKTNRMMDSGAIHIANADSVATITQQQQIQIYKSREIANRLNGLHRTLDRMGETVDKIEQTLNTKLPMEWSNQDKTMDLMGFKLEDMQSSLELTQQSLNDMMPIISNLDRADVTITELEETLSGASVSLSMAADRIADESSNKKSSGSNNGAVDNNIMDATIKRVDRVAMMLVDTEYDFSKTTAAFAEEIRGTVHVEFTNLQKSLQSIDEDWPLHSGGVGAVGAGGESSASQTLDEAVDEAADNVVRPYSPLSSPRITESDGVTAGTGNNYAAVAPATVFRIAIDDPTDVELAALAREVMNGGGVSSVGGGGVSSDVASTASAAISTAATADNAVDFSGAVVVTPRTKFQKFLGKLLDMSPKSRYASAAALMFIGVAVPVAWLLTVGFSS